MEHNSQRTMEIRPLLALVERERKDDHNGVVYRVLEGDTLESIAWRFFQNRSMKRAIQTANGMTNEMISAGTELRIPTIHDFGFTADGQARVPGRKAGQISAITETYTGRGGETLDYLAHQYYREPRFAYIIAAYNQRTLGHVVQPDEKILIPFKIVEFKAGESIFQLAERETHLRDYFVKLLMINRKTNPKPGDRLRVPPVRV